MKKIILLTLIIIVALAPIANAFEMRLKNTADKTLVYKLDWLACDWEGFPKIINMAGGELDAGKEQVTINSYKPGPYAITWENLSSSNDKFYKSYLFEVEKGKCVIISTPESEPIIE